MHVVFEIACQSQPQPGDGALGACLACFDKSCCSMGWDFTCVKEGTGSLKQACTCWSSSVVVAASFPLKI